MCGFTLTPPGLRPSGASIASWAGGLSYFTRHAGHVLAFWTNCALVAPSGAEPAAMCMSCGCHSLLDCEMPHTVCRSPAGYLTESQDYVRITAAGASRSASAPLPTRLGRLTLPLAMLVRRLVRREVGTTRYSPAADVPRFRASEPPFVPRHLHRHDNHALLGCDRPLAREAWACMGCP